MAKSVPAPDKKEKFPLEEVSRFFPTPDKKSDPNYPPLTKISEVLQNQGVSKSQLREAMAVIIGIMSSKLGDPCPIVLTEDEGAGAIDLLGSCLNLVPDDCWVDGQVLDKKSGVSANGTDHKTVVLFNGDSFQGAMSQLLIEIEKSGAFGARKNKVGITPGASAFVAIVKSPDSPVLRNRYVTRIHLTADKQSKQERLNRLAKQSGLDINKRMMVESACSKTLLRRVRAMPVDISFADQIFEQGVVNIQNAVPICELSVRFLKNITRINNAPPLHSFEQSAAFIGLDFNKFFSDDQAPSPSRFNATKVDYFYFLTVFGAIFQKVNDFISQRQMSIYQVIYDHNIRALNHLRKQHPTDQQLLTYLHENNTTNSRMTREQIIAKLKESGAEEISDSTMHRELIELERRELIKRRRIKGRKYQYEYAAIQVLDSSPIFTKDFSKIEDPVYRKGKIQARHLITGDVEEF
jgi:hypothetical protein